MMLLASAIVIASTAAPSLAQVMEPIMISTDKMSYSAGDMIMISGEVRDRFTGVPATLMIVSPNGNVVEVAQMDVGQDGKFAQDVHPGGMFWATSGTYTITASYNNQEATTTFEFVNEVRDAEPVAPTMNKVSVDGGESGMFDVSYTITGGSIDGITVDGDISTLAVEINAMDDGMLTLVLPREVIDAKTNGCEGNDDDFFVMIDGAEEEFAEEKDDMLRTLTIEFVAGSEMIEVIGTCAVPEFGAIAAMILAVALVSIIAFTARSKLGIVPRY